MSDTNPIKTAVAALFGTRKVPPQVRAQELRQRIESIDAEAAALADEIKAEESALVASSIAGKTDTKRANTIAALRAREQGLALARGELERAAADADAAHSEELRLAAIAADKALARRRQDALAEAFALAAEAMRLSQRWGGGLHLVGLPQEFVEVIQPLPVRRPWYELAHDEDLLAVDVAASQRVQKAIRKALSIDMGDDSEPGKIEALRNEQARSEQAQRDHEEIESKKALAALAGKPWSVDDVLNHADELHSLSRKCSEQSIPCEALHRALAGAAHKDPSLTWRQVDPVSALDGVVPGQPVPEPSI